MILYLNILRCHFLAIEERLLMGIVKTKAVVLRYADYKEADRMLTLFTVKNGKMTVSAKGCRRPKSRLLGATQLFNYGDYILYTRNNSNISVLSQAEVHDSFFDIRYDIDKLSYASLFTNVTEEVLNENEENYSLFYLLIQMLSYLCYSSINKDILSVTFFIKLICILGYRPWLDSCVVCSSKQYLDYFSIEHGGSLCKDCYMNGYNGYTIHKGSINTIKYIIDMNLNKLNAFKIDQAILEELNGILANYITGIVGKKLKTLEFMKSNFKLRKK